MIRRQFLSTLILLVLVNLIIKAIFIFGIDLQVQQRVGQPTYGLYFTLLNLCYIFQIINDFGLNLVHNTDTAAYGYVRKEKWAQILKLKIGLSIFYSVVVVIIAIILGYMYAWQLLGWLILNNILVSMILILRAGISGSARYKTEALISVMDKAIMIFICGFLLFRFSSFQIEWFVWAQTVSLVITLLVAWLISSKFISRIKSELENFNAKGLLREAFPFTLATFLMFVYMRSDSIMIEKLMPDGAASVGVYAAGFRLLDAANMIAFLFSPLLIPMYVRLKGDQQQTFDLLQLASGLMICMTGIISIGSFFWAEEIIALCYGTVDDNWTESFRYLILSHIPIGLMYIYSSYLTAMRELNKQNILFTVGVVLNIALNLILIPRIGVKGAAITSVITQSIIAIGLVFLTYRNLKFNLDLKTVLGSLGYILIVVVAAWFFRESDMHWMREMVSFVGISILIAFGLKLLRWKEFMELIGKR